MPALKRQTQAERRESTIARLLDATIVLLAESGYAQLTVAAVCDRAGLSQGALFRHFSSRIELISEATEEICRRHMALVGSGLGDIKHTGNRAALRAFVTSLRAAARTEAHAAWHEVMVAARTDAALHTLVAPTLQAFERAILSEITRLTDRKPSMRLGTVLLSIMHMLDSEAVTVAVYPNPMVEADRVEWLVDLLQRELPDR